MHLGIITCEILRREIHDLIKWTGIKRVFIVLPDTTNPAILMASREMNTRFLTELAKEEEIEIKEKRLDDIRREIKDNKLMDSVIIMVMELRLHDYPWKLLAAIGDGLKELSPVVDLVLLGYGLCGCTSDGMEELIRKAPVPVVIPRGARGEILNNCIEIALGRERVQELLSEEAGTFFMTPAGASIIKEPQVILKSSINIMAGGWGYNYRCRSATATAAAIDTSNIIKLLKNHYKRVIKVCYSEADERDEEFERVVRNFAAKFGLMIESVRGSSRAMTDALASFLSSSHQEPRTRSLKGENSCPPPS